MADRSGVFGSLADGACSVKKESGDPSGFNAEASIGHLLKAFVELCEAAAERGAAKAFELQRRGGGDDTFAGKQIVTPRQVARAAKVADGDVYEALKTGRLKGERGKNAEWRIDKVDAMAWIKGIKRC